MRLKCVLPSKGTWSYIYHHISHGDWEITVVSVHFYPGEQWNQLNVISRSQVIRKTKKIKNVRSGGSTEAKGACAHEASTCKCRFWFPLKCLTTKKLGFRPKLSGVLFFFKIDHKWDRVNFPFSDFGKEFLKSKEKLFQCPNHQRTVLHRQTSRSISGEMTLIYCLSKGWRWQGTAQYMVEEN